MLLGALTFLPAEAATASMTANPASGLPGAALTVTASGLPAYSLAALAITVQRQATTAPTPAPSPTPAPAPAPSSTFQDRVLQLVNGARAQAGLTPLVNNAALTKSAQSYSALMASTSCFAHTCGPVPDVSQRDIQAGYTGWTTVGENIAAGYTTPEDVFNGWMNSPPHKANILNASFRESGVGVATGGSYGIYWTQEFGAR